MRFEHEERATTTATAAAVWALWNDPGTWAVWDPAVEAVTIELVEGAEGTITLSGFEVPLVVERVAPGSGYLSRITMGELVIRIDHVVTDTDAGADIVVITTIAGPGASDVGPMVVHDAPVALATVCAMAEGR
jgi:hypothetical protein